MTWWWLLVPLSYLAGSFPTAHLVGILTGTDPSSQGSGNPGASNVYRVAGRRAGVAVLVIDLLKGFVPALIGVVADGRALGVACGVAAMLGHVFPLMRGFRGGKGVATLGGACVFLYPLVALALLAVWAVTMRLFRRPSVGSLVLAVLLPVGVAIAGRPAWEVAVMAGAALVVIARHWANIKRIATNEEHALPR